MTQQNNTGGVHGGNGIKPATDNGGVHGGNGIKPTTGNGGVHGGNGIKPATGSFGAPGDTCAQQNEDKPVITIETDRFKLSIYTPL